MDFSIFFLFYLGILSLATITCWYRYSTVDTAMKVWCILLPITLVTEGMAYILAQKYKNNMPVYDVYNILELVLNAVYFNYAIDIFRATRAGYYIAAASALLGILYYAFFQSLFAFNTQFLLFEGLCIITMAIISCYRLYMHDDQLRMFRHPHFLVAIILLFFWSMTLAHWGLYHLLLVKYPEVEKNLLLPLWGVNILTYLGIACVFIFYDKLDALHE